MIEKKTFLVPIGFATVYIKRHVERAGQHDGDTHNGHKSIDLNSDMGGRFGRRAVGEGKDDTIMRLIGSANITTGFYAGGSNIRNRTMLVAREHALAAAHTSVSATRSGLACATFLKAPDRWPTPSCINRGLVRICPAAKDAAAAHQVARCAVPDRGVR